MNVKFGSVLDGDNVINKTFTQVVLLDIKLRHDFDVVTPTLIVSEPDGISLFSCNYIIFDSLARNYFITDIVNLGGRRYRIDARCDVLETYKSEVLNSNARFKRNIRTGDYNNVTVDLNYNKIITKHESNVDITGQESLIMTTIGEG